MTLIYSYNSGHKFNTCQMQVKCNVFYCRQCSQCYNYGSVHCTDDLKIWFTVIFYICTKDTS